jgi:asparagine synthase (glutamine-hydrolysing)
VFTEEEKQKLFIQYNPDWKYTEITARYYQETEEYPPVNRMQYIDIHTWLRGDILLKADKMTMAHSLELRVPFLDPAVFEVASKIPPEMKTANNTTKYILRKAAEGIVPDHVIYRDKLGFPVPIRHWLRNELYDWARNLIRESETDCYFRKEVLYQMLEDHYKQKVDYGRKLWTVFTFMIWHQIYIEQKYNIQEWIATKKEATGANDNVASLMGDK